MERREPLEGLSLIADDERGIDQLEGPSIYTSFNQVPANRKSSKNIEKSSNAKKDCFRNLWRGNWTAESCSYLVSLLALGGLVVILLVHQGKPLPQWPQLVTINSIVSIFSMLMRTCVGVVLTEGISQCKWVWFQQSKRLIHMDRFDSASRSSWGAIRLLYYFQPQKAYCLAALGAIVTIMASLTGFFTQQIVLFQDCLELNEAASVRVSKTNNYTRAGKLLTPISQQGYSEYDPMIAAIHIGIIQPVEDPTNVLSRGCSSGTCTFPSTNRGSFSTVGIGHVCEDVTPQIRLLNLTNTTSTNKVEHINLELDYGEDKTKLLDWRNSDIVLETWTHNNHSVIDTIYIVSRPKSNSNNYTAINCSLFPTINSYNVIIEESVLREELVSTVPLLTVNDQFPQALESDDELREETFKWRYKMVTEHTIQNGVTKSCIGSKSLEPGFVRFIKKIDDPIPLNSTGQTSVPTWKWWYFPQDCVWSMSEASVVGMRKTIAKIFDNIELYQIRQEGITGPVHQRWLFQGGNITMDTINKLMRSLTTSMTSVVRTHGEEGSAWDLKGNEWVNTTCVYIRWPWLTFPAVMIGLTGIFLLLIVIENRSVESDRLWKSSFLAVLFCSVELLQDRPIGKEEIVRTAKSTSVYIDEKSSSLTLLAS